MPLPRRRSRLWSAPLLEASRACNSSASDPPPAPLFNNLQFLLVSARDMICTASCATTPKTRHKRSHSAKVGQIRTRLHLTWFRRERGALVYQTACPEKRDTKHCQGMLPVTPQTRTTRQLQFCSRADCANKT